MGHIYRVTQAELAINPVEALPQLQAGSYRTLSADQVRRLRAYVAGTMAHLKGYDQMQDYYFLESGEDDTLPNRPQMVPNSPITKGYNREQLIKGGRL